MTTKTIQIDDDTQEVLEQLVKGTGLSASAVFKQGLFALRDRLPGQPSKSAYEIYKELDLGPGGYGVGSAAEAKQGVREAIRRKHAR
ncbi:MAG: hypothetical protein WAM82_20245 [Thermoanaerobaculia bacterium]